VSLWLVAGVAFLAATIAFVVAELRSGADAAPAVCLASPMAVTVALIFVSLPSVWLLTFLAPAAPDLAHVVFFVVLRRHARSA
jgi:hypothetical protein